MAYIYCSNKTPTTLTVKLLSLDTSWVEGLRTVVWYVVPAGNVEYAGDATGYLLNNMSSINTGVSSGGECVLNNLNSGTRYHIKAVVMSDNTLETLATLYGTATTTAFSGGGSSGETTETPTPDIILSKDLGDLSRTFGYRGDSHTYVVEMSITLHPNYSWLQYRYRKVGNIGWIESNLITDDTSNIYELHFEICSEYELQARLYSAKLGKYSYWSNIITFETQGITTWGLGLSSTSSQMVYYFDKSYIDTLANDASCSYMITIRKKFEDVTYEEETLTPSDIQQVTLDNERYARAIVPSQGTGAYSVEIDVITVHGGRYYRGINYYDGSVEYGYVLRTWNALEMTNITYKRTNGGFAVNWSVVSEASSYSLLISDCDGNTVLYQANILTTSFLVTGLNCSENFVIEVRPMNSSFNSQWSSVTAMTAPAQPILELNSCIDGQIFVNYSLKQVHSLIDVIYITLYKSDGTTVVERKTAATTSGVVTFSGLESGNYIVKSITEYHDIQCVDENGNNYTAILNVILLGEKPQKWEWKQMYELSSGGLGTISESAYVPIDASEFHPVTANEWNDFIKRVNEIRAWASNKGAVVSGSDLVAVGIGDDFKTGYNLAVEAIKNINGAGGYLTQISSGDELNSRLLIYIADKLNEVLDI